MPSATHPKRFRIAFSFAGERRDFVEATARILAQRFGKEKILYDKFHEAELARYDLGIYLPKLYGEQSELIVPVLCADYDRKRWTGWEWVHIYGLLTQADGHRVMPSRFDYADADGLSPAAGFIELDDKTPQQFAALILERLAINQGLPRDHYPKDHHQEDRGHRMLETSTADNSPLSRLYSQLEKLTAKVIDTPQWLAIHFYGRWQMENCLSLSPTFIGIVVRPILINCYGISPAP